jgi:hypothetical protein
MPTISAIENRASCRFFESCDAQLCPRDSSSLKHGCWYTDEPMCRCRPAPDFVKAQKKIQKKFQDPDRGYFTHAMLEVVQRVTDDLTGIQPEDPKRAKKEQAWIRGVRRSQKVSAKRGFRG